MALLEDKNIFLISPESWGINFVSKHHYALELAKKNSVWFLNPPSGSHKITNITPSLFVIDYKPAFRGLGKLPSFLSAVFIKKEILRIEKQAGIAFDIIWNFDSSRFFNLSRVKNKSKITHLVDLSEHFQRPLLAKTSDICFCTTEAIAREMRKYNPKTFNIGHGVQEPGGTRVLTDKEKSELNNNYKYKAAYIGNLSIKYLDWEVIYLLVQQNTEVAFFFIGPLGNSNLSRSSDSDTFGINKVKSLKNVFLVGEKPAEKILVYLEEMDILLLTYKSGQYRDQLANPHKMLEYLASGKVIVASWTDEYKDKKHLLEMVKSNDQLPEKFKEVISRLDYYNSPEKQAIRRKYALENTYEKKIDEIGQIIQKTQIKI